ncbi:MAG TPA: hypothetical protein VHH36_02055 [Candidatus Thermoplasmatota archaeon]|nr:hypothetical protein [Candidatus Thermoplasmatota archaeon]
MSRRLLATTLAVSLTLLAPAYGAASLRPVDSEIWLQGGSLGSGGSDGNATDDPKYPSLGVDVPAPDGLFPRARPCSSAVGVSFLAGDIDNFAGPTGATSPGAALSNYMSTNSIAPQRGFDQGGANREFGHTFSGLPPNILDATLRIVLKDAGDVNPPTDAVSLQMTSPSSFAWGARLDAVSSWPGPGAVTVTLQLDALAGGVGDSYLIDDMNGLGRLDVYLQDDAAVDHMILDVLYCPCQLPVSWLIQQGGATDNFAGYEAPTPDWTASARGYDDPGANRHFATTLYSPYGATPCLREGYLEIRLKGHSSLASNDYLTFRDPWNANNAIHVEPVPWSAATTLTIPLSASVLASVEGSGMLRIHLQDDHDVDYVKLVLTYL